MIEKLIQYDRHLFLFLNNLGNSHWDWFWLGITNKWMAIPFYALLLYLIYRKFGLKATGITLLVIAAMIAASDQLANVFKNGFERLRPCGQKGVMEYARFVAVRCGKYGYYSAHASSTMAVAVFIGLITKKWYKYLFGILILWAILVAYSRIYIGVHYPLDVFSGMCMGAMLGFLFSLLHTFLLKKWKASV